MRGIEGYQVREGLLTKEQCDKLDKAISNSIDKICTVIVSKDAANRIYIMRLDNDPVYIWGIGSRDDKETQATIWGNDESQMIAAVNDANIKDFFPYNTPIKEIFFIKNGQAWVSALEKDKKVDTPMGKGKIWSIDESVCVELDSNNSILHEFDFAEVELV